MKSTMNLLHVIPAQAEIQLICKARVADKTQCRHALRGFFNQLDSRLRGNDEVKGDEPC